MAQPHRVPSWIRHEHHARYAFAAQFVRGKRIIECACGGGLWAGELLRSDPTHIDAIDASVTAIRAARALGLGPRIRFEQADALQLPVADRTAEVFISLETIEHLDADRAFLAEVRRVLKPEGLFICSTPNRRIASPGCSLADRPWNPFHVREYTQDEFVRLLSRSFARIELFGQNPQPPSHVALLDWAGRALPRRLAGSAARIRKLPALWSDAYALHEVQPIEAGAVYEYLVAVCFLPIAGEG